MYVYSSIQKFINKVISLGMIEKQDEIYVRNQLLALLHLTGFSEKIMRLDDENEVWEKQEIPDILDEIVNYAIKDGIIKNLFDDKEILSSHIMNVFMSKPSEVNNSFYRRYIKSPQKATKYFYELSQNSNYIQMKRISKNIKYKTDTPYGELDITINLSKPEKDPKEIEREQEMKIVDFHYPKCLLCIENEGYEGRISHPARSNHRMIRLDLTGEPWFFQYSPYMYYNEHCIILSKEHRNMIINKSAFTRLLEFVEKFPHYFIGSNADLPIVGGSILTHDHYQGGNYEFAMAKADDDMSFTISAFPNIKAVTVKWPMSVIRLRSKDKERLINASDYIFEKWKHYTDKDAAIFPSTNGVSHNTITPIARKRNDQFEVDLVLRNNRTNQSHPLGIFHPHHDVHHIKKENIGLIEVMGLAVLPARLRNELEEVKRYLLGELNQTANYHQSWADKMKSQYKDEITASTVTEIVQKEVGFKFLKCLEDAGVFKRTEEGQKAFRKFLSSL